MTDNYWQSKIRKRGNSIFHLLFTFSTVNVRPDNVLSSEAETQTQNGIKKDEKGVRLLRRY